MSDSWAFSPCCHSEQITPLSHKCNHCGGIFHTPLTVIALAEVLLYELYWPCWSGREGSYSRVCPFCLNGESVGLKPPFSVTRYFCDECGQTFKADLLIIEVWEGDDV